MPFRSFKCTACEQITEDLQDMMEKTVPACTHCGEPTKRSYKAEAFQKHKTGEFSTPITMYSVALSPDEIHDFRTTMPDVPLDMGCPVARNRPEKMRILKYFGYQENN